MARVKLHLDAYTHQHADKDEFARVWVPSSVAKKLDVSPGDWVYMSRDWIGVLSTQAMVEEILESDDDSEEGKLYLSPDRMDDAHYEDGDRIKAWKLTEWE